MLDDLQFIVWNYITESHVEYYPNSTKVWFKYKTVSGRIEGLHLGYWGKIQFRSYYYFSNNVRIRV